MRDTLGLSVIEDKEGSRVVFRGSAGGVSGEVAHAPQSSLRTYVPPAKGGFDMSKHVWDKRGKKVDHPTKAERPK